jgi:hypothetical protein
MKAWIGGACVDLTDRDLLGVGGEARVYRWRDLAVKLFHPVDPKLKRADKARAQSVLDAKIEKIRRFPQGLPKQVVAPLQLVNDDRGAAIGFTMQAVKGSEDVLRLGQRKWREGVVSNAAVTLLFRNLHTALQGVHAARVVVGDLNDSNVLFTGEEPWLIDADSMQFDGHPCVVGHERFLDPRLYGLDLTKGCLFTRETDWYAYAVLLFSSLLYVHPYGGVHLSYPTPLRRAEARHSVLRPDVTYPKGAAPYRILPDEVLDWFEGVFDKDRRGVFPVRLLDLGWTACKCGLEHARAACPACAAARPLAVREAVRFHGKCRQVVLFQTPGRILAAAVQGKLRYLYEQDGVVRREDGSRVLEQELAPELRFALAGDSTWIGLGPKLVRVHKERVEERASTQVLGRLPAFDANSLALYRLQDEWLVDGAGLRIGKILEGQTWLRVGEQLGFGLYRAGLLTFHFLFRVGRPGLVHVELPHIDGRLIDAAAAFDERHVLFTISVEKAGQRHNSMFLIGSDGKVLARASAQAHASRMLASIQGKAVWGGRILASTDQGLLALSVDAASGSIHEGTFFTDTEPFVEAGAEILPGPQGSVYLVTTKQIAQLSLA